MKRLLLLTIICTSAFSACTKDDGGGSAGGKNIEIEVLDLNGDFRHIKVDSAYVYNFESHFQEAICDKDGIEMPQVDFSTSALIAVTGVSPTLAESISPKLVKTGSGYVLNIDVKCSESEYVKPRKWSLLLKAPASVDPSMECNITYDKTFDAQQLPDTTFIQSRYYYDGQKDGWEIKLEPMVIMDSAYLVVVEKSNVDKVKQAVNADDRCIITNITHAMGFQYRIPDGISVYDCNSIVLKNCSYDKVIAPMGDMVLHIALGGYYASHYVEGAAYLFYLPQVIGYPLYNASTEHAASLFESLGCTTSGNEEPDSGTHFRAGVGREAKINVFQAYYMLAADGFLADDHGTVRHFAELAKPFDKAEKEFYE